MEWKDALNYGLPAVLLYYLLMELRKVILWAKTDVVTPMVAAHLELVTTLRTAVPELGAKLDRMVILAASTATQQSKQMDELQQLMEGQTGTLKQAIDYQTQVLEDHRTNDKANGGKV